MAHVWTELRDHLRWRSRRHASSGGYGTLQKTSYLLLIFVFVPFMILTGVAQSPGYTAAMPVLLDMFGGRQSARTLHTIGTVVLVLFVVVHLLEIAAAGFVTRVRSMITGKESIAVNTERSHHEQAHLTANMAGERPGAGWSVADHRMLAREVHAADGARAA